MKWDNTIRLYNVAILDDFDRQNFLKEIVKTLLS